MAKRKSKKQDARKFQIIIALLIVGAIILGASYFYQEQQYQEGGGRYDKPGAYEDISLTREKKAVKENVGHLVKSFKRNGYVDVSDTEISVLYMGGYYVMGIWEDDKLGTVSAYIVSDNSEWKDVYVGREPIPCSSMDPYEDFPRYIVTECLE